MVTQYSMMLDSERMKALKSVPELAVVGVTILSILRPRFTQPRTLCPHPWIWREISLKIKERSSSRIEWLKAYPTHPWFLCITRKFITHPYLNYAATLPGGRYIYGSTHFIQGLTVTYSSYKGLWRNSNVASKVSKLVSEIVKYAVDRVGSLNDYCAHHE